MQSSLIVLPDSAVFSQLILRKIIKTVATRCQISRLKCTKIQFRLGLRSRPRWGSLQRSPDPLAGFKGPTSKGRGREGTGGREGRAGKGRGGEGREKLGGHVLPLHLGGQTPLHAVLNNLKKHS